MTNRREDTPFATVLSRQSTHHPQPEHSTLSISESDPAFLRRQSLFWKKQRIVTIPVCNEEEHIIPCLLALAVQKPLPDRVVLWINNTIDSTYDKALSLTDRLPFELKIVSVFYEPSVASAGIARRDAMAYAAKTASPDAILLTTDADGTVAKDWIENILAAFIRYPVEAVFGRALLLPKEYRKIPFHLHEDEKKEQAYGALLDQIRLLLNPEPHDPWPRHLEHSGASIAVTHQAWKKVGGIPLLPSGEDRQFYRALRQNGIPVRHAPEVKVYVSARLQGRAHGGMAETLARRLIAQDEYIDDAFEPVSRHLLRLRKERAYWHESHSSFDEKPYPELPTFPIRRNELALHHERALRVLNCLRQMTRHPSTHKTTARYDSPHPALPDQATTFFHDSSE
ncbi:glycosyltransferase [Acetobacter sp.]|uniref:glycosyltransferase n=1 Tax=Acetobacter sp. TaxID=440 RepID=UPI0039E9C5D0